MSHYFQAGTAVLQHLFAIWYVVILRAAKLQSQNPADLPPIYPVWPRTMDSATSRGMTWCHPESCSEGSCVTVLKSVSGHGAPRASAARMAAAEPPRMGLWRTSESQDRITLALRLPHQFESGLNQMMRVPPILQLPFWLICCLLLSLPVRAQTTLTGPLLQGGLVIGTTTPGASVWQDDQPVRVSRAGTFLIGFDRDMPETSRLRIRYADGATEHRVLPIEQRQYAIQRIRLPDHKVTPMTPQAIGRVRRDSRLLRAARRRDDDRQDFMAGFIWPVTGPISGVYGSQRILNGQKKHPHYGVDLARPTGTPVVAPAAGIVTVAAPDMFYSGGTLVIDHGHQLTSALLHLSELAVRVGDRVQQGQPVGRVGATGRATGPHLDWRMKLRRHQIDPQLLVPPIPGNTP